MLGFQSDIAVSPLEIAINVVGLHALAYNISGFNTHLVYGADTFFPDILDEAFRIVAYATDDLAAIATAGPPADPPAFEQHHVVAALGELQCGVNAAEATTDDHDIAVNVVFEARVVCFPIGGGRVVGPGVFTALAGFAQTKHRVLREGVNPSFALMTGQG